MGHLPPVLSSATSSLNLAEVQQADMRLPSYVTLPPLRDTRKVQRENEESRLSALLVCLLSRSFRFATVILERQRPRKRENDTYKRVSSTEETRNSLLTVLDTGLVIRSVKRKTNMMRRHMSRVVLCRKQCMFTLSHLSRAPFRLRKAQRSPSLRHLLQSHRCW